MKLQLVILLWVLAAIDADMKVLAAAATIISLPTSFPDDALASPSPRIQLFGRLPNNTSKVPSSTPIPTDNDRAQDLRPLADAMVVLTAFAVFAIIAGEGWKFWRRRALRREAQGGEARGVLAGVDVDD
jgi:hypothetical protein